MSEQVEETDSQPLEEEQPRVAYPSDVPASAGNAGIVYVLSNPAMPNYLKIGITRGDSPEDVGRRMKGLNTTSVPLAFECEFAALVDNYEQVEKALHTAFGDYRKATNREFFHELEAFRVKAVLELLLFRDVTPGQGIGDETSRLGVGTNEEVPFPRTYAPSFTFGMVGIDIGEHLEFVGDSTIQCTVADEKTQVEYKEERYSISGLAKLLKGTSYALAGPRYWKYKGETLQALRDRLEREQMESEDVAGN